MRKSAEKKTFCFAIKVAFFGLNKTEKSRGFNLDLLNWFHDRRLGEKTQKGEKNGAKNVS